MDDSDLDRTPNPFSAFAESRAESRRNLVTTAKFLTFVVALFCIVSVVQVYLQRARLSQILHEFSEGTSAEKLNQLEELRASGAAGISGLTAALADDQAQVSSMAADLLLSMNREWMSLPVDQLEARRKAFALGLADVSAKIEDSSDPRWTRVQYLARRAARDLIDSGCSEGDDAYQALMTVIASDSSGVPDSSRLSHRQMDQGHSSRGEQELVKPRPLPIDLVDNAGASWTDWPPTASTPKLYPRRVASLEPLHETSVVLKQADELAQPINSEARLLKPRVRPASTLADRTRQMAAGELRTTSDWILQLNSGSRLVRMQAVAELGKRRENLADDALRNHLETESDDEIRLRIRQQLNQ